MQQFSKRYNNWQGKYKFHPGRGWGVFCQPRQSKDIANYTLKNAKDISALKAVSQNLMHANLSITDGVYGILSQMDVREQITTLGKANTLSEVNNIELLIKLMTQYLERT